ncbi:ketoacyl-synthetase C-terminal extension domain-containing protein, partial [Frankia sp. CpI1-P]|uniref:ketoacyl-synthetase C-terminal extension domain-containing protein n=1 Tax=Frankia sp. CpI1-P TaxID=1502734 RepID=UPI0026F44372
MTVPDARAQESVIRLACARAGVDPTEVQYVELHGTGTPVGDPIEAAALGAALGADRDDDDALLVGSVKTNVGHLEGAAGITGLLKAILSIRHREIPASLNFETPNPRIPLAELGLRVARQLGPWPRAELPLIAGVSSFGMGGTNCHVVLTEAPTGPAGRLARTPDADAAGIDQPALPFPVSARTAGALRAQAARLSTRLAAGTGPSLTDVGYSLATTRTTFEHRAVVVARDHDELRAGLEALADGRATPQVTEGRAGTDVPVFLLPGQGSQRAGAGQVLYRGYPVFAAALDEACAHLDPHLDRPLRDVLFA